MLHSRCGLPPMLHLHGDKSRSVILRAMNNKIGNPRTQLADHLSVKPELLLRCFLKWKVSLSAKYFTKKFDSNHCNIPPKFAALIWEVWPNLRNSAFLLSVRTNQSMINITYRETGWQIPTGVTNTTCQKMIFSTFEVKIKLYFIFKSVFRF